VNTKQYIQFVDSEPTLQHYEQKNDKGMVLEEAAYDELGHLQLRTINEYENDIRLISSKRFDENDELIEEQNWLFEGDTISQKVTHYPEGGSLIETYRREGNVLTILSADEDGEFEGAIKEVFDSQNRVVEVVRTNFQNKIDNINRYEYNDKGQTIKISAFDGKNYFLQAVAYYYDESGNRIAEEELNSKNQAISRTLHKYEATRLTQTQSNSETIRWEYKNDQLSKITTQHPDGTAEISVYEYRDNQLSKISNYLNPLGDQVEMEHLVWTKTFEISE